MITAGMIIVAGIAAIGLHKYFTGGQDQKSELAELADVASAALHIETLSGPRLACLREQLTMNCLERMPDRYRDGKSLRPVFPGAPQGFSPKNYRANFANMTFSALTWPAQPNQRGIPNWHASPGENDEAIPVWLTWPDLNQIIDPDGEEPHWDTLEAKSNTNTFHELLGLHQELSDGLAFPPPGASWKVNPHFVSQTEPVPDTCTNTESPNVYDQEMQPLLYKTQLNHTAFEYIRSEHLYNAIGQKLFSTKYSELSFPFGVHGFGPERLGAKRGAIFVKSAWKILNSQEIEDKQFFSVSNSVVDLLPGKKVTVGLVGLHIGLKVLIEHSTYKKPQWVWATFEHVQNAPIDEHPMLCTEKFIPEKKRQVCFSDDYTCKQKYACVPTSPGAASKTDFEYENQFTFYDPNCINRCKLECRQPLTNCKKICEANTEKIADCKLTQVTSEQTICDDIKTAKDPLCVHLRLDANQKTRASVWEYYRLIDAQWTLARLRRGRNRLSLQPFRVTNPAIETFRQRDDGGCEGCHERIASSCDPKTPLQYDRIIGLQNATRKY
ncbi:MAG: hypothetical protein NXI24_18295 [bacterium]|nr:hypothetical protein [bacterium]